eukprot:gnl/Hemi2/7477_TR2564_c0_g1_i1.p1 gnl/Hemi2/7477_TR2564_c0_g1~~gnl/Hemi2/7477_TR2564_c0_g1_i1.p1  ORF type:complete len:363 (-),score=120.75 gnl/Hemi2/7477_TR2564_c0_g1_i1:52-1140(-)
MGSCQSNKLDEDKKQNGRSVRRSNSIMNMKSPAQRTADQQRNVRFADSVVQRADTKEAQARERRERDNELVMLLYQLRSEGRAEAFEIQLPMSVHELNLDGEQSTDGLPGLNQPLTDELRHQIQAAVERAQQDSSFGQQPVCLEEDQEQSEFYRVYGWDPDDSAGPAEAHTSTALSASPSLGSFGGDGGDGGEDALADSGFSLPADDFGVYSPGGFDEGAFAESTDDFLHVHAADGTLHSEFTPTRERRQGTPHTHSGRRLGSGSGRSRAVADFDDTSSSDPELAATPNVFSNVDGPVDLNTSRVFSSGGGGGSATRALSAPSNVHETPGAGGRRAYPSPRRAPPRQPVFPNLGEDHYYTNM